VLFIAPEPSTLLTKIFLPAGALGDTYRKLRIDSPGGLSFQKASKSTSIKAFANLTWKACPAGLRKGYRSPLPLREHKPASAVSRNLKALERTGGETLQPALQEASMEPAGPCCPLRREGCLVTIQGCPSRRDYYEDRRHSANAARFNRLSTRRRTFMHQPLR
jgi:hypothetical protein